MAYCSINDIITSIELPAAIPDRFLRNPRSRLDCDGMVFIYTNENESLQVNVCYTKDIITSEDVVMSHIPVATVHAQQVVV
jgi:hypothetical protein